MPKPRKMRVPLPENPEKIIKLSKSIYEKHLSLGAASPLNSMEGYNWNIQGPGIVPALQFHTDAENYKKLMEKCYRDRDRYIDDLDGANKASRDVLTGIYSKNMKHMGDWGFTVDDTPKAKKEPTK